jgi:hypothetical protein
MTRAVGRKAAVLAGMGAVGVAVERFERESADAGEVR